MAKAILVLDEMPVDCEDCPLSFNASGLGIRCNVTKNFLGQHWSCPLKPMPKVEPEYNPEIHPCDEPFDAGYIEGWNDCLKAITEGE